MCKYCESEIELLDKVYEDGSTFADYNMSALIKYEPVWKKYCIIITPVEFENGKPQKRRSVALPIKYCPICGKELKESD